MKFLLHIEKLLEKGEFLLYFDLLWEIIMFYANNPRDGKKKQRKRDMRSFTLDKSCAKQRGFSAWQARESSEKRHNKLYT
jgi:hypothetical protein